MVRIFLLVAVSVFLCGCNEGVLNEGVTFDVWPAGHLGESATSRGTREYIKEKDIYHLNDVLLPSMTVYPAKGDGLRPTVLICPGGGYYILAIDLEGTEIAEWLNGQGITAVILRYRVPKNPEGAFADVQRAMGLLRHRADEFNIDPERIGVIGFSAGAHLSARLSTNFATRSYAAVDGADEESCKPNFAMLIYPYLLKRKEGGFDEKSLEEIFVVTGETPPAILVHTEDDLPESSILYFQALKKAGVAAELHVFPSGGHGYGLRQRSEHAVSGWPELCNVWLKGVLNK